MRIDVLTLFPEILQGFLDHSIVGRARAAGVADIRLVNFRDFAQDRHRTVDDAPFGGGPGMVLKPEPLFAAVEALREEEGAGRPLLYLSPKGERFTQAVAEELASLPAFALLCGRYEGVDQRVVDHLVDREISVGDYVLSGGEPAAAVVVDAVVRLLPGALGDGASTEEESFRGGLLEYPHYTRPALFRGWAVPEILLSGNHEAIRRWRLDQAVELTRRKRPDLLSWGAPAERRP
ncbi:MAG: tRNA (guanosine(37)-N1)-methyltransferase TrmD [Acidobacteriota bacterium]